MSLRIKRDEHIPESCRAAWIEREFGVRFVRPSGKMPLVLEGDLEAVTGAQAHLEQLVADRRFAKVCRY